MGNIDEWKKGIVSFLIIQFHQRSCFFDSSCPKR